MCVCVGVHVCLFVCCTEIGIVICGHCGHHGACNTHKHTHTHIVVCVCVCVCVCVYVCVCEYFLYDHNWMLDGH